MWKLLSGLITVAIYYMQERVVCFLKLIEEEVSAYLITFCGIINWNGVWLLLSLDMFKLFKKNKDGQKVPTEFLWIIIAFLIMMFWKIYYGNI